MKSRLACLNYQFGSNEEDKLTGCQLTQISLTYLVQVKSDC